MSALVDERIRRPALLEAQITKEIARRVASVDARNREAETKFAAIEKLFADKEAKMAAAGYQLDLLRQRRPEGLA
jgi:hypothetical protein